MRKPENLAGDVWGGLSAMLVALPSAIAFGVTIFAPLGGSYVAQGALAGILGTTALGLVAPALGGTNRLITAPCAPAAAVLAAFALEATQRGVAPDAIVIMLALVALLCGVIQFAFGMVGLGRLIKYMPYPVVSGYLSAVGLIIIGSQVPKFLGVPKGNSLWQAIVSPPQWAWQGVVVGLVTIAVMVFAPRVTKAVPAAILGIAAGFAAYFALGLADRSLLALEANKLVIGPLGAAGIGGIFEVMAGRFAAIKALHFANVAAVFSPALTLAVLLSIDTLKTCVVLDALTRSRHNSNRELIGQGLGNISATLVGGIPGAGTMGATLVNITSGAKTRLSGMMEGVFALIAFLALANVIAWVPIAALAAILIVIGFRMIDRHSFQLLRSRSTILDFVVIVAVIVVALAANLIAASAVGIALAILLFIREQVGGSVVRRRVLGSQVFSKQVRLPEEMRVLEQRGDATAIFELQGSLFFGTTNQLFTALEADLKTRKYVILDLRRVQSVDFTAAHMLEQVADTMAEQHGHLLFSHVPRNVPSGKDMQSYLDQVGLVRAEHEVRVFPELDDALEWVENRLLEEERLERGEEKPLELREIEIFKKRKDETLALLEHCLDKRSFKAGEKIAALGETSDELFLVRRGAVRIVLPLDGAGSHHLATFGRGDFFGEMSFLDHEPRSADAIADSDTDLYVLSRERFDQLADEHKRLAINLLEGLARSLAVRLRHTNKELRALEEN